MFTIGGQPRYSPALYVFCNLVIKPARGRSVISVILQSSFVSDYRFKFTMRYVLVVVLLCAVLKYGSTIMCYECNSAINSLCLEKVLPETLKRNCSDHDRGVTHTMCRKIVQHVDHSVNGKYPESRVIRSCGWDESKFKGICYHRAGYGGRQEVCSCMTDYCNGAHAHSSSILMIFTMLPLFGFILCK